MDWQETMALLIVAATATAFVWRKLRPRKFSFERDTHCGCSSPAAGGHSPSVTLHARKGEAPRVTVRSQ